MLHGSTLASSLSFLFYFSVFLFYFILFFLRFRFNGLLHGATPSLSSSSSFSPFLCFFFFFWFKFVGKQETVKTGLITVLRTVWSDRGLHESLFLLIERFFRLKEPQKLTVRGFSGRTVRSGPGFKTLLIRSPGSILVWYINTCKLQRPPKSMYGKWKQRTNHFPYLNYAVMNSNMI